MTKEQLIKEAEAKGATVHFIPNNYLLELYGPELIGIRFKGKYTYHWFRTWVYDGHVEIIESYSMLTGKTKKGFRHRRRIEESLNYYEY